MIVRKVGLCGVSKTTILFFFEVRPKNLCLIQQYEDEFPTCKSYHYGSSESPDEDR